MLNSPVLNLVILLSFTYFVGSLMLSAINESISAGLKIRANDLMGTLKDLLLDDEWKNYVNETMLKSHYIKSLMKDKTQYPSYIPSKTFLYTIIEAVKPNQYTLQNLQSGIDGSGLPDSMKNILTNIWAKAQGDVNSTKNAITIFEEEVENFYNNAMDRATGWYKRKTRRIMLIMGFLLAAFLNIDTIKIINDALGDKAKLSASVDKIIQTLPELKMENPNKGHVTNDSTRTLNYNKVDSILTSTKYKIDSLKAAYNNITGFQLGYNQNHIFYDWEPKDGENGLLVVVLKLLGLTITAFAFQLGSNYWFDLLNKAVNLRATGKKPNDMNKNK